MLTGMSIIFGFSTFILTNPKYYNIKKDAIGAEMGNICTIDESFVICLDILCGPIFDLIGRKWPVVFGTLVQGICMLLIPMFHTVFPGFLIFRVCTHLGTIIYMNAPLLPDYV